MGLLDWFRPRPPAAPRCAFCADPVAADLDELASDGASATYLCRCPACGQFWGGHGYTPQYRWELSPEEAARFFPHAFGPTCGMPDAEPGAASDRSRNADPGG